MKKRLLWLGLLVVLVTLIGIGTTYLSFAKAGPVASSDDHGPWVVVLGTSGSSGYLLNRESGQIWFLENSNKTAVSDSHPQPGK